MNWVPTLNKGESGFHIQQAPQTYSSLPAQPPSLWGYFPPMNIWTVLVFSLKKKESKAKVQSFLLQQGLLPFLC